MEIHWIRRSDSLVFNRPSTWFCLGVRGSGKSSFLEAVGENYLAQDATILDLFGSRDGEGLAWLRSPQMKDRKALLICGENVDVKSSYPVKPVSKLVLSDFESYDLIVSASPLYSSMGDEFTQAAQITDLLYRRLHYKKLVYCLMRECSNFLYSRLKVEDSQTQAKASMTYMLREARHCGLALGLDSIRWTAIDIDVRSLSDYLILKSQGLGGLGHDLRWLYGMFNPTSIQNMAAGHFVIISRRGAVGIGKFPEVRWHKKEREDILRGAGIEVEFTEEVKLGKDKGTFKTVGDQEHSEMIRVYVEDDVGIGKVGERVGRSSKTVHDHIIAHNEALQRSGFCPQCSRVKSSLATIEAKRGAMPKGTAQVSGDEENATDEDW